MNSPHTLYWEHTDLRKVVWVEQGICKRLNRFSVINKLAILYAITFIINVGTLPWFMFKVLVRI